MKTLSFNFLLLTTILVHSLYSSLGHADEEAWTGFYAGIQGGYGLAQSTGAFSTPPSPGNVIGSTYFLSDSVPPVNAAGAGSLNMHSLLGGFTLGYNYADLNTLWGLEMDVTATNLNREQTKTGSYPCCGASVFTVKRAIKANWLSTLRGRLGYLVENDAFYFTAGLAIAKLKAESEFYDNLSDPVHPIINLNNIKLGWAAGIGYEHQFDNDLSIKMDYLHARFRDISSTVNSAPTYPNTLFTDRENLNANLLRIGINKTWP